MNSKPRYFYAPPYESKSEMENFETWERKKLNRFCHQATDKILVQGSQINQLNEDKTKLCEEISELWKEIFRLREIEKTTDLVTDRWSRRCQRMQDTNDRLLVLATKWCDIDHHDWDEIKQITGEK